MDPLVDEYNVVKKGDINSGVMQRAVAETRKFIVRLGLCTLGLLAVSLTVS